MAADTNMAEAHMGQMAQEQASAQKVKDYGQTLSKDHTSSYEALSVLATKTGTSIPKALPPDRNVSRLAHLKGSSFDHAFAQEEVQMHRSAMVAFKREAEHGTDPDVKAWAQSQLPTLEGHLQAAQDLTKKK